MTHSRKSFYGLLLILVLILIPLPGCGRGGGGSNNTINSGGSSGDTGDGSSDGDIVIPTNTEVLNDTTTQTLSSVSSDGSTLTFSQNATQIQSVSPGDIIVIGESDSAPYGLLKKVTDVSTVGNEVVVETTEAAITDAIQSGAIQISKTLTQVDLKAAKPLKKGVSLGQNNTAKAVFQKANTVQRAVEVLEWTLNLKDVVLYDVDGDEINSTTDQIKINGSISLDLGFDLNMDIKNFQIDQLSFINKATTKADIKLSSGVSKSLKKEVRLYSFEFKPIVAWVGYVPVYITPVVAINVGFDGSVTAGITTNASQQAILTSGLSYNNGEWSPVSDLTNEYSYTLPTLSAGADVKVYGGPKLDLLIYGSASPSADIYGYFKLDANTISNPWWTLYGGLESNIGFKFKVLDRVIADYNSKIIDYSVVLTSAGGPWIDITAPSTPTGLAASAASSGEINLSWDISTDDVGVAGYKVYRNGSFLKTAISASTSDTGLSPSTTYCYTVSAYDAEWNESGQSSQACATTPAAADTTAPSTPANLTATASSSSEINLSWTASPESDLAGYKVYRNGSYLKSASATSTTDTGLNSSTQYCYAVSAYDTTGNESDKTASTCATTVAAITTPTTPSNLSATALSQTTIALTWQDNSDNETGFKIERKTGSGGTYSQITTASAISGTGTGGYYEDTGLSAGTTYCYKIRAYNSAGDSSYSTESCSATNNSAPSAPTGVSTTAGNGQVTVSWNAVSGTISYNIYWSTTSGVTKSTGTKISNVTTPYIHTGLTKDTTYYYVVTAVGVGGESGESSQVSATTNGTGGMTFTW